VAQFLAAAHVTAPRPRVSQDQTPARPGPKGLVLLLRDPPEEEAKSLAVASRLGATTARLENLKHCWMAEAPERVAAVLPEFWSSVEG